MTSQHKWLVALALTMLASGVSAAQAQDCSNEATLKSSTQGAAVALSFRNASNEARRLYWLDQNGNRRFVSVVQPRSIYSQPTAATHSWVVTDDTEKCLYAVTATAEAQTIDVGGQTAGQIAPPEGGTQQSIVAAPVPNADTARSITVEPGADPAPVTATPNVEEPVSDVASNVVADASDASGEASGEDVQVQVPQVSPIEQLGLTGNLRVLAVAEEGKSLNNQASGTVEVVRVNPEWDSGQWSFEPVSESPFVRIKNNWKRTYLADVNGQLKAVAAPADADPSHWSIEPVDGTAYVQLRNRETDSFLLNVNGAPSLVKDFRQDEERQSYWQVNPATDAVAVTAPRMAALSAYNSAISDCRDIGGVWTGSSCRSNYAAMGYGVTQPLACRRGWFWDQESGECLYEVASGGAACPPWQQGPGGQCVSNLTCRGGSLRNSRRGASCDCPFGMAPWGNYPNLSCKPSVARIVPLLLLSKLGGSLNTKHGGPRLALGQAFGNKQFGKGLQTNAKNGNVIIKVSKASPLTNVGPNAGKIIKPVILTGPVIGNLNSGRPIGNNPGGTKPVGNLPNSNPVISNTNQTTNPKTDAKNNPPLNDAAQTACRLNPNSPACRAGNTAGRTTPVGTNQNPDPSKVGPVNNQQVQNDAKAKADADAKAKADSANKLNVEAENKAKVEAANRAKIEADNKTKADAANRVKVESENKAKLEAANKAKIEGDNKAKADAANKAKVEAANRAKLEADNKAKADAANRAKLEAANKARIDAANQARLNAAKLRAENAKQAEQARNAAALRQQAQAKARQVNNSRPNVRTQSSGCPGGKRRLPNGACA